jgi:hypothetical protein
MLTLTSDSPCNIHPQPLAEKTCKKYMRKDVFKEKERKLILSKLYILYRFQMLGDTFIAIMKVADINSMDLII